MRYIPILIGLFVISSYPGITWARHNTYDVNRGSLDNDCVEEFPIPILFGIEYEDINPDFGDPRGDGTRFHEGEDLLAPKSAPIISPTEAIVIRTGDGDSSGKYVYTANPGGETFRYMHLDTIAGIGSGDRLDPGDFIGTVGDTGNAPDGVYHLHFETRNKKNVAEDPYPRLKDSFTLKEKISFLPDIFKKIKNDAVYAQFLVKTYPKEFRDAVKAGYTLPAAIKTALGSSGVVSEGRSLAQIETVLKSIPTLVVTDMREGDQGPTVMLVQLYLMYMSSGTESDALKLSGPTGYYGARTSAAMAEYQEQKKLTVTRAYDAATRKAMVADTTAHLEL